MSTGRMVYVIDENIMGEVVSEQVYGAYIKFYKGGFETIEYMTAEDYEYLEDFEESDE